MAEDAALTKTGIFGGMSVCCFVCLCIFGIPLGIAGIIMIVYGWFVFGVYVTGIIFVVIASLMALIGLIALILTCVYGSKIGPGSPPPQRGATVVVTSPGVFVTNTSHQQPVGFVAQQPQPMGYTGTPPAPQPQPGGFYGTNPATQPAYMSPTGGPQPPAYQSTYPPEDPNGYDRPPAYNEPPKPHYY